MFLRMHKKRLDDLWCGAAVLFWSSVSRCVQVAAEAVKTRPKKIILAGKVLIEGRPANICSVTNRLNSYVLIVGVLKQFDQRRLQSPARARYTAILLPHPILH